MIHDIQRVARLLNINQLSLEEYLNHGGKYGADIIDDCDCGGFANKCALAGLKLKVDKKQMKADIKELRRSKRNKNGRDHQS